MLLKSLCIIHLELYPFQKPPTNFSDEAEFLYLMQYDFAYEMDKEIISSKKGRVHVMGEVEKDVLAFSRHAVMYPTATA